MSEKAKFFGREGSTKIERYGWSVKDAQGEQVMLHKNILKVDRSYQRMVADLKVRGISAAWSWVACGAIIVGNRNGEYWVIDGQHRVIAARNRSDITTLPCLVFETEGVSQEARGFLDVNTARKAMTSIDKFRALIAAGDETAIFVNDILIELDITVSSTTGKHRGLKSVGWALRNAKADRVSFEAVIRLAGSICHNYMVHEKLLEGLLYLHTHGHDVTERWLANKIRTIGPEMLVMSANRAAAFYVAGGAKVWAEGMLTAINKGLRDKIKL